MGMDSMSDVSSILLEWLSSLVEGNGIVLSALSDSAITNGSALLAILNFFDSYECPFRPSDSVR
jgi:hypothetical protein